MDNEAFEMDSNMEEDPIMILNEFNSQIIFYFSNYKILLSFHKLHINKPCPS